MRRCLEVVKRGSINPFYIEELISYLRIKITDYNFIISDIDAYVFKEQEEVSLSIFDNGYCLVSGEEFLKLTQEYNILFMFGIITLIDKNNLFKEIEDLPKIEDNPGYWKKDYLSPIPNFELEIGLSDTTHLLFTVNDPKKMDEFNINSIDLDILGANLIQL